MAMYGMHSGLFPGYMWIFQIIIVVLFFLIVWWLLKNSQKTITGEKPSEILKTRLAKGEITKNEYDKLKKEIE